MTIPVLNHVRFARQNTLWTMIVALAFVASAASGSTNFMYDIYQQTPSTFPSNPPWSDNGALFGFINGSDSATASGRLLTLVDGPEFNDPSHYWSHSLSAPEISSTSEYEVRARFRVLSYGDLGGGERALFNAVIEDGSRYMGIGGSLVGGQARIFLIDGGFTPFIVTNAVLSGDDFFNVVLRKTGTTGTSADWVDLIVNGTVVDLGFYPGHSQNYGNMPGPDPTRAIYFGTAASPSYGTVQLTGVSFGINEAAPALLPEPSTAALVIGVLVVCLSTRRRFVPPRH